MATYHHQECDLDLWPLLQPHLITLQRRARSGVIYCLAGSTLRRWSHTTPGHYGVVLIYSFQPNFIYAIAEKVPLGQAVTPEQLLCYRLVRQ